MLFITSLLFGGLSASFALIIEILIETLSIASPVVTQTFSLQTLLVLSGIATIEELSKYIFLQQYAKRFLTVLPFITKKILGLGVIFGLGFASLETALVWYHSTPSSLWPLVGTASLHIITSTAFAILLFSADAKRFTRLLIIALAIFFHIFYNILVLF